MAWVMKHTVTVDEAFRLAIMFSGRRVDDLMPTDLHATTIAEMRIFTECLGDLNTEAEEQRPVEITGYIPGTKEVVLRNRWPSGR